MAMNDTLSNVLSNILNCERVGRSICTVRPTSKLITQVLDLLNQNNYLGTYKLISAAKGGYLEVNLTGHINKCGVIKPRFSVGTEDFDKFEKRFLPAKDVGILIVSTSQGIMTHQEAIKKSIGGKLIAYCY